MSLLTYEQVRPWARSIKTRVASARCRRGTSTSTIGIQKFKDDPSLSDDEIATIVQLGRRRRAAGQPGRHAAAAPVRRDRATGRSASPIWSSSSRPTPCRRPVPICSASCSRRHPDRRRPLHQGHPDALGHARSRTRSCITRCRIRWTVTEGAEMAMADGGSSSSSTRRARTPRSIRTVPACCCKKGQQARLSYHLHSIGEETKAEVELGIVLYPKGYVPKHIRWSRQLAQPTTPLDIPAGTVSRSDGYTILHKPARLLAFQPHMHNLGKRQCLEVIYPTSGTRDDDRDAQLRRLQQQLAPHLQLRRDAQPLLPAGTILHNIQWHDNTKANPRALDPKNWVGDGQRTIDEMGFFWIGWVELTDEEYKTQLAERKAQQPDQQRPAAAAVGVAMTSRLRFTLAAAAAVADAVASAAARAGSRASSSTTSSTTRGQAVQPIFEGWSWAPDSSINMHFGYLNRNYVGAAGDCRVAPNNSIEPGGPDRGQPTFFYTRTQRNLFTVNVPKDVGQDARAGLDGHRSTARPSARSGWLQPEWEIDPVGGAGAGGGNTEPGTHGQQGAVDHRDAAGRRGPAGRHHARQRDRRRRAARSQGHARSPPSARKRRRRCRVASMRRSTYRSWRRARARASGRPATSRPLGTGVTWMVWRGPARHPGRAALHRAEGRPGRDRGPVHEAG